MRRVWARESRDQRHKLSSLPQYKCWCSSELAADAPGLAASTGAEGAHSWSPVQEPHRANIACPKKDAPAQFKGKASSSCTSRPPPTAQHGTTRHGHPWPGTCKPPWLHAASGCKAGKMVCSNGPWESCWLGARACSDDEDQDSHALALQFIDILLALSRQRKASQQIKRSQMQWGLAFQSWLGWDTSLQLPACPHTSLSLPSEPNSR